MSDKLLEQHIRQYIESQTGDEVTFSWQGGEPTVMGLDFYKKAVELQARYRKNDQRIENDLQTNGLLLDEDWARFLKQSGFHVGLSLDGPRELHNKHRPTKGGAPTFDKVMQAAELLARHEIPFAILSVVNRDIARHPLNVWRFLTTINGTYRVQFTPCVEPQTFKKKPPSLNDPDAPIVGDSRTRPDHPESIVTEWSVDARDYGEFLCTIWREWLENGFGRIHVNVFESAVAQSLGQPAQMCTAAPICGKALALEQDGNLYSCDHFVYDEYKLGNIRDTHEGDLAFSKKQIDFGMAKSDSLPDYCRRCNQLSLCWGECPKNRLLRSPDGQHGLNYLCEGLKRFYTQVQQDMPEIRQRLGL